MMRRALNQFYTYHQNRPSKSSNYISVEEREPLTHLMADLSREKDKQHLSYPITAEYRKEA